MSKMTFCHCAGTVHIQSGSGKQNCEKMTLEARPEDTRRRCFSSGFRHVQHVRSNTALTKKGATQAREYKTAAQHFLACGGHFLACCDI